MRFQFRMGKQGLQTKSLAIGVLQILRQSVSRETSIASDGEVQFGQSDDPNRSLESILGLNSQQAPATQNINEQTQTATGERPAVASDGLTPSQRAQVKWDLMKQGLSRWLSENWPYVLAGGVVSCGGIATTTGN